MLWTLQARVRKLTAAAGEGSAAEVAAATAAAPPLIFVTGDTSYGSCCVDEVSAQHLKADAIVHYGEIVFSSPFKLRSCFDSYFFSAVYLGKSSLFATKRDFPALRTSWR